MSIVTTSVVFFLYALIICMVVRALLSWFPVRPNRDLVRVLDRVTGPLLQPVRRVLPPFGMFDMSAFVVIVLLWIMVSVVQRAADY